MSKMIANVVIGVMSMTDTQSRIVIPGLTALFVHEIAIIIVVTIALAMRVIVVVMIVVSIIFIVMIVMDIEIIVMEQH